MGGRGKRKREILGLPPFGPPPLVEAQFFLGLGPTLWGHDTHPDPYGLANDRLAKIGLSNIGLAKIGFGQNSPGQNHDGQKWIGQIWSNQDGQYGSLQSWFSDGSPSQKMAQLRLASVAVTK